MNCPRCGSPWYHKIAMRTDDKFFPVIYCDNCGRIFDEDTNELAIIKLAERDQLRACVDQLEANMHVASGTITTLRDQNHDLREALGEYANAENWDEYDSTEHGEVLDIWWGDGPGWTRARAALAQDALK